MRLALAFIATLLLGVAIGGHAFSRTVQRPFLTVHDCEPACLSIKDIAGLMGSAGIHLAPGLLPYLAAQSAHCVAVRHPRPEGRFHLVFLPRRDVRNIMELTADDLPSLAGCLALAREQLALAGIRDYRVVTNGPGLQHVTYLHVHVIAD